MSQSDIARPENPAPIEEPKVYEACKEFLLKYTLPAMEEENIRQGWQNRASLPMGTNEYAIISILFDTRNGTNVETFTEGLDDDSPFGSLSIRSLVEVQAQIDFCAESDVARQRARRIETITRSSTGVQFFNEHGLTARYADDVRDLSFVGDAKQFVRRYSTTLRLSYWSGVSVDMEYFNKAEMARVEDVDAHHPR